MKRLQKPRFIEVGYDEDEDCAFDAVNSWSRWTGKKKLKNIATKVVIYRQNNVVI